MENQTLDCRKSMEDRLAECEEQLARLTVLLKELEGKVLQHSDKKAEISGKIKSGDTFWLNNFQWKVLDIANKGYMCIANSTQIRMSHSNRSNDWKISKIRKYLNKTFYKALSKCIGEENIIEFERDLTSMDGQTEYGTCADKVSILNFDEYKKYRKFLPNGNYRWWLLTPWSTPCNDYEAPMVTVEGDGTIDDTSADQHWFVHPVCIFAPTIFESENFIR